MNHKGHKGHKGHGCSKGSPVLCLQQAPHLASESKHGRKTIPRMCPKTRRTNYNELSWLSMIIMVFPMGWSPKLGMLGVSLPMPCAWQLEVARALENHDWSLDLGDFKASLFWNPPNSMLAMNLPMWSTSGLPKHPAEGSCIPLFHLAKERQTLRPPEHSGLCNSCLIGACLSYNLQ